MENVNWIAVEVAYAMPNKQSIIPLQVTVGTTAFAAVVQSQILQHYPDLNLDNISMGIFGKVLKQPKVTILKAGDRVELYRPLLADPKEVRKRRAKQRV